MAITIKDVALKANVSIATVSLVIHENTRISAETRSKVNRVIKELNYHPSRSARGLASRKTGNIGFILTDDHFLRSEPFYTRIFIGAEIQARQEEYYILLTTVPGNFQAEERLPRFVLERNVDGIIFAGKVPDTIIKGIEKYEMPMAFVDYSPPEGNFPAVLIDNMSGGLLAVRHLVNLGHRNIAFIAGDIGHPSIKERFKGYKQALEFADIKFNPELCIIDEDYPARENGFCAARKLMEKGLNVSAIFACNDAMAIGVMQFLKEKGYRIPRDISLIGFDDVEADRSLDPPLSTINVPKTEMGLQVLKLMSEMLKTNTTRTDTIISIPVELIIRGSTGQSIYY